MKGIMDMMKQAQQMQEKIQQMQSELENMEAVGTSGAGSVRVTLNGKGALTGVEINPDLLKADEKIILEDLLVAAHADAKAKVEQLTQSKMQEMAGGLPLPPGMNLF